MPILALVIQNFHYFPNPSISLHTLPLSIVTSSLLQWFGYVLPFTLTTCCVLSQDQPSSKKSHFTYEVLIVCPPPPPIFLRGYCSRNLTDSNRCLDRPPPPPDGVPQRQEPCFILVLSSALLQFLEPSRGPTNVCDQVRLFTAVRTGREDPSKAPRGAEGPGLGGNVACTWVPPPRAFAK